MKIYRKIYKCIFFTNPSGHRNIWTDLNPGPWRFSNPGFELSLYFSCLITTHVARCNLNQQLRHALKQIRQPVFIPSHEVDQVGQKVEATLFWYCIKLGGYWTLVFLLMMLVLLKDIWSHQHFWKFGKSFNVYTAGVMWGCLLYYKRSTSFTKLFWIIPLN